MQTLEKLKQILKKAVVEGSLEVSVDVLNQSVVINDIVFSMEEVDHLTKTLENNPSILEVIKTKKGLALDPLLNTFPMNDVEGLGGIFTKTIEDDEKKALREEIDKLKKEIAELKKRKSVLNFPSDFTHKKDFKAKLPTEKIQEMLNEVVESELPFCVIVEENVVVVKAKTDEGTSFYIVKGDLFTARLDENGNKQ